MICVEQAERDVVSTSRMNGQLERSQGDSTRTATHLDWGGEGAPSSRVLGIEEERAGLSETIGIEGGHGPII